MGVLASSSALGRWIAFVDSKALPFLNALCSPPWDSDVGLGYASLDCGLAGKDLRVGADPTSSGWSPITPHNRAHNLCPIPMLDL